MIRVLIEALADGQFHSGESLGQLLGISRAAVWKRLSALPERGIALESIRGTGYRIPGGLELLEAEALASACGIPVSVLDETASTNDVALQQLKSGESRFAVLAEYQSAGRGRRGRQWVSPYGSNLFLSFGWLFPVGALRLEGLSLAVGVEVAEAFENAGLHDVKLKWPNDIWIKDKKIGGILIELAGDLQDSCAAVIGIGINGKIPLQDTGIDQPWTDFSLETGAPMPRNMLAENLICRLQSLCGTFPDTGFSFWKESFVARDALCGREVVVRTLSEATGIVTGVTDSGALKVDINGQESVFNGGEISLRPVHRMADDL